MKKIYCYNKKFPEYAIKEMIINDEEYICNSKTKYLTGIYTNSDLYSEGKTETERYYSIYNIYEDEEIFVHDISAQNQIIFSYNKNKLVDMRNKSIKNIINSLEERLTKLKEAIINNE